MSLARDRLFQYVESLKRLTFGEGRRLFGLLNQVEDDRAHAEAVKLREKVESWGFPATPRAEDTARAWRTVADEIDPYEEKDGVLVRKSDGKPVSL